MRLLHSARATSAAFDDPSLVSCAGLVPVMRLAQRCGLAGLVADRVRIASSARPVSKGNPGVRPARKVTALVAGMLAGADSIDDVDVIRHGGMSKLFGDVYAPSTLGSHLRAYDFGNACQLESAGRALLPRLARHPAVLPGLGRVGYLDLDDTRRRIFGHAKSGGGFGPVKVGGYSIKLRNLDPLLAVLSTPISAPMVAATRLRGGNAASARGAASFATQAINAARAAGAEGLLLVRADSAFYNHKVIAACADAGARFSVTVAMNPSARAAIEVIASGEWTTINYPEAIWDEQLRCWISDAEIAETTYTAFTSTPCPVTARLIVRRVKDKNPKAHQAGQGELFTAWRYHAVFTDTPMPLEQAEATHRDHAVVEQVLADLADGPLAHLPSGSFAANAAWLTCSAISHNLLHAAGALASTFHSKARGHTLRRHLINLPARIARSARRLTLHLPEHWPWQHAFQNLFHTTHDPPPTA